MYNDKYMKHFGEPQNIGEIPDADAFCEVKHQGGGCFDTIMLFIKVNDGRIADIKYKVRACSGTIAAGSAITTLARGKSLDEAMKIDFDIVNEELGGVPEKKYHSIELAVEAVRNTINKYKKAEPN